MYLSAKIPLPDMTEKPTVITILPEGLPRIKPPIQVISQQLV